MRVRALMRAVRLLNLSQIARRPLRAALAVVSVAAGVSLLSAVVIEEHSYTTTIAHVTRQLAGPTPLRVVSPSSHGGIDVGLAAKLRTVSGVAAAIPVVQTVADARGSRGHLLVIALGVDFPGAPSYPAATPALVGQLGADAVLRTDVGRMPVTAVAPPPYLRNFNSSRVVLLPLATAQRVFARVGQVDTIYIAVDPGVDVEQLQRRLAHVVPIQDTVMRNNQRPRTDNSNLLLPMLGLIGLVALAIAGLLVWNMASLALAERRRELAIAAAMGSTPRVTVIGVLAEASIQGVIGGVIGSAMGIVIAHPLVASLSQQIEMYSGIHMHVHASLGTLLVGPVLGALTAALAAWVPARRATRLDVAAELHARSRADAPPALRSARTALAISAVGMAGLVACLVAGSHAATSTWQPPLGTAGLLVSLIAFTGLAVVVAPLLIRAVRPWARRRGGVADVAVRALAAEPRRTGIAATAVAAAVAFSSVLVAAIPAIDAVTVKLFGGVIDNRVYVSTLDFNNTAAIDSKASPQLRAKLAALPGVSSVDSNVFVQAPVDGDRSFLAATELTPPRFSVVEGNVDPAVLDRGYVFVGPGLARRHHLHPGSEVTLDTFVGRVRLPVAAVWVDPDNIGSAVTMSMSMLTKLYGPQPPSALFVRPKAGVSADALAAEIRAAKLDPDIIVQSPRQFLDALATSVRDMLAPFWTLQRALLLVALIATLSTLLLVGVQRRRELGTLAALGLSPRALASMTVIEALLVGVTGCALGIFGGVVTGIGLLADAVFISGASPAFTFDPTAALGYAAIALIVVVIGASWPAWRTSRLVVVEALRHE